MTDAGTPGISDPGEDLVKLCAENGIAVVSVPGACAAVNALAASGLSTRYFLFEGFLEGKDSAKKERLTELSAYKQTLIFYEAPHRLTDTLALMEQTLGGDRKISLCRELTKRNEEIVRTTISEAVKKYTEEAPRGEFVLVVDGRKAQADVFWSEMTVSEHVDYYVNNMSLDKMSAIKAVAKDRGVPKNAIYKELI